MKLPARVWSQLGVLPVRAEPIALRAGQEVADFGEFMHMKREILINSDGGDATKLSTLFHEMAHVAIWDAGGANVLSDAQTEWVCDAIGSYLAGAVFAGYLKFSAPKE
jgi:hypothetical protein